MREFQPVNFNQKNQIIEIKLIINMFFQRIIYLHINRVINTTFRHGFCVQNFKDNILDSMYHKNGPSALQRNTKIQQPTMKAIMVSINHIEKSLNTKRQDLLKQASNNTLKAMAKQKYLQTQQVQKYLDTYLDLINLVKSCPINNKWTCNLIGWYNMTFFLPHLIDRLLNSSTQQLQYLVSYLSWMKYESNTLQRIIDKDPEKRRKKLLFFKRLSGDLELSTLHQLQQVFPTSHNYSKRIYYQHYANQNIIKILKNSSGNTSHIIWFFSAYVQAMNDNEKLVSQLEQYIIKLKPKLQFEAVKHLINVYALKGRINKQIYSHYIKPYLLKNTMGELSTLIQTLKFLIDSESEDNALLKQIYDLIEIKYNPSIFIQSKHLYMLHLYTHYLRIKGYRIKLPSSLQDKIHHQCVDRAESRFSLNRAILQNKEVNDKIANSKSKFISPCLNIRNTVVKQYQPPSRSDFQQSFHDKLVQVELKDIKIYQKPVFCSFELDYCFVKEATSEFINVEIQGMTYIFSSGRPIRQKQIRDQILTHYGFKINHIFYNYYKLKTRLTEEDLLMTKPTTNQ